MTNKYELWRTGKTHRCSERVYTGERGDFGGHQCEFNATSECDGKWFCGRHNPIVVSIRRKALEAKWDKESAERHLKYARDDAIKIASKDLTTEELQKLNPSLLKAAPDMYEALKTLINMYWKNKGSDGKICPHPGEFIACITPNDIPKYWRTAGEALAKAGGK